jgi:outer membrane protein assembly factor BamA
MNILANTINRSLVSHCALGALACLLTIPATFAAELQPGAIKMEKEGGAPNSVPGDVEDTLEAESKTKNELVIAPLPSHTPLLGWTIAVPAMYLWNPKNGHPDNRPWVSGAVGFYTENDSWGAGVFQSLSLGGDQWRLKGALFTTNINYDYYGIGGDGTGPSVPLEQPIDMFTVEALRQTIPNLFVGLKYVYSKSSVGIGTDLDCNAAPLPQQCQALKDQFPVDFNIATLAPRVQYDTRDNQFYPRSGFLIDGTLAIGSDKWGSDDDYEKLTLDVNHYYTIGAKGVLATRLDTQYASEDSPFFIFPAFGSNVDLRGYQTGTYRDQFLIAAQTEYRHRFSRRWGGVVFAGVGTVDEDFLGWGETLPSIGFGGRFVVAPKNDMSLRLDVAWGKDDKQFYVGMGEAF